jgi:Papain family cysteine protease
MMVTVLKDLRGKFGHARDQGSRPTCLAFATSDVHAASRSLPFVPLSPEYLYFHAVQRSTPPDPSDGITLMAAASALKLDGQPIEEDWPYLDTLPSNASWKPPNGVSVFRQTLSSKAKSTAAVIKAIDSDSPVLLCLKISEAFYTPDSVGIVKFVKNDPDTGHHALIAVAHGLLGSDSMILVRNSWGEDWGLKGHGWLHLAYVSDRLHSVSLIP